MLSKVGKQADLNLKREELERKKKEREKEDE